MNDVNASIGITRVEGKLSEVKVIMPTWNRVGSDDKLYINIPLFGIETFGKDENDCDLALEEAIKCFCLLAEEEGLGLDFELEFMGWKIDENSDKSNHIFNVSPTTPAFERMMQTGSQTAFAISI
jgi:hypothetical protein